MARSLYVAFDIFPRAKGSTSHIASMIRALARNFGSVRLLCLGTPDMPPFQREEGIDIYRFQQRHRNLLGRATAFARFVAGHTRQLAGHLQLAVFRDPWGGHPLLGARPGCPTIFEVNALPSWELHYSRPGIASNRTLAAKLGDIERRCLRQCDRILCVSSVTARALAAAGYARSKMEVIPNVAHDAFFEAARQPCPIPQLSDGRWFGYIGGLQPWQGVETLVDSFGEVASDLPDCRLLILHGDTRTTTTRSTRRPRSGTLAGYAARGGRCDGAVAVHRGTAGRHSSEYGTGLLSRQDGGIDGVRYSGDCIRPCGMPRVDGA